MSSRATTTHTLPAAVALRTLREGGGGQTLVVLAEPRDNATFPAGLRREPASSALEAVLSYCADEGGYDRIWVFSGMNHADTGHHLPSGLTVGDGLIVGLYAGVWEWRGPAEQPAPGTAAAPAAPTTGIEALLLSMTQGIQSGIAQRQSGKPGRRLENFQGQRNWVEQTESVLKRIDEALGRQFVRDGFTNVAGAVQHRTLLILDEDLLIPRVDQLESVLGLSPYLRHRLELRLNGLPQALARPGARVDLILLVRTRTSLAALANGRMIHDQVMRLTPGVGDGQDSNPHLPRMHWRAEHCRAIELPACDPETPFTPHLARDVRFGTVTEALRHIPPRKPLAVRPRPAADPTTPDLRFWSQIDLDALRRQLETKVIGQRAVIERVLGSLAAFRETCQDALANGHTSFPREGTQKPNKSHRPPVFLFAGESGMGKTHIAEVVAGQLFGAGHYEKIEMGQKSATDELMGVRLGYAGCNSRKKFHEYSGRTGGMGLVVFDELDKLARESATQGLDDAVAGFLVALENWCYLPNNPEFANAPDGRIHFANTIVVFTGNFLTDREPPRHGYKRLSELGGPFLGRLNHQLPFGVLQSTDVPAAVAFFLAKYCAGLLANLFIPGQVTIDPAVLAVLAHEFDTLTAGHPTARTFRVLEDSFLPARLPDSVLKPKFRGGDLTVGRADLADEWRPSGGQEP